ncbi:Lrp/AsnC family transcriptional regulator [Candidatus Woesearchaeota archaeon]|nr:Lrp/AsnC family transcriptional regulator [Candidatus Woesearchaeota archaeon]
MIENHLLEYGERIKLDGKDKKIIEQLQKNAKQSISQVARKTNLPRDVVKYRIKRLEENKIVRFYHAFLNPSKLGFPLYVYAMFSLYNIEPEEESKFVSFLRQHPNLIYVAKTSGKWDFCIGVCARDYKQFDEVLREIRKKFTGVLKDYEAMPIIQEYKYDWMADLIE